VSDTTATGASESVEATPEPELLHGCIVTTALGQTVVHATREQYLGLLKALADDGFELCADLAGVDHLTSLARTLPAGVTPERFEVVVNLVHLREARRLRIRVQVPAADTTLASAFDLWPGTEAMEREAFDMFGIVFDGHPDLTRILMPEDWIGHPLRKDYDVGRIPVQFKAAPEAR
jgi:NADH-quinone oxidoreductase subunit C